MQLPLLFPGARGVKPDFQRLRRPERPKPIGPFHDGHAVGARVVPAQIEDFLSLSQSVKIEVGQGKIGEVVALTEGKGRARNDQIGVPGQ